MKKASIRRRLAAILACALAAAIVVSGAYAVTLLSQFDTNEFAGKGLRYDATLNEEFLEEGNWKYGDPAINKLISVTNTGTTEGNYGEVYVRLQLKEFLEFYEVEYKYWAIGADGKATPVSADGNPALFMTTSVSNADDTSLKTGDLTYVVVTGSSGDDLITVKANAAVQYPALLGLDANIFGPDKDGNERVFVYMKDAVSGAEGWFVQTRAGDINGQYGKWVVADFTSDKTGGTRIDPRVFKATSQDYGQHDQSSTARTECKYTPYIMEEGLADYAFSAAFREYVQWNFGSLVMPLSEWKGEECWVYDDAVTQAAIANPSSDYTVADIGWFYWSHPLTPDENHATLKKTTDILLKSIELAKQPEGDFYYAIHVDMDAQSTPWITAPVFTVSPASAQTVAPGGSVSFNSELDGVDKTDVTDWTLSGIAQLSASSYTIAPLSVGASSGVWSFDEIVGTDGKTTVILNASEDAENDDFIYVVAKYSGYTVSIKVTVSTIHIDASGLDNPKVGEAYEGQLEPKDGDITWKLAEGSDPLPPGLTLNSDGTITGTPTTPGEYTFTVEATNDDGTVTKDITLVVDPADVADTELPTKKPPAGPLGFGSTQNADPDLDRSTHAKVVSGVQDFIGSERFCCILLSDILGEGVDPADVTVEAVDTALEDYIMKAQDPVDYDDDEIDPTSIMFTWLPTGDSSTAASKFNALNSDTTVVAKIGINNAWAVTTDVRLTRVVGDVTQEAIVTVTFYFNHSGFAP